MIFVRDGVFFLVRVATLFVTVSGLFNRRASLNGMTTIIIETNTIKDAKTRWRILFPDVDFVI